MITIVEPDPTVASRLAAALAHGDLPPSTLVSTVADLGANGDAAASVLVAGPGVALGSVTEVAGQRRLRHPGSSVVLVRPFVDQAVLAEAIRSGMSDVVAYGDDPALLDAVRRSVQQAQAFSRALGERGDADPEGSRRVRALQVTVFSTKGGVGKTLVAVNLAATLADAGRRTCVVDLDVQAGDVALMLQLTPQHTIADLDLIHGAIDEAAVRSLITEHSENLDVLAAPLRLDAQVRPDAVGAVLDVLGSMYDVVVVDTSGAFDDFAVHALDRCDQLVLVGTVDVLSLKNLKLTVGTLDLLGLPRDRWRLVLNRADDRIGIGPSDFEETLGLSPVASIPGSREVLASVNRGEPVVRSAARQPAARGLAKLGALLLQDTTPAPRPAPAPADGRRRRDRRRAGRTGKVAS
jgi:pilus assembly protein CpaE